MVNEIILEIGSRSHIRVWQNQTGVARSFDGDRVIAYGLKGSGDILGFIAPYGRFLCIEVKTGSAEQTPGQKAFQKVVEKFGGLYILAKSLDDVLARL